jgi:hypothetical protein
VGQLKLQLCRGEGGEREGRGGGVSLRRWAAKCRRRGTGHKGCGGRGETSRLSENSAQRNQGRDRMG